MRIPTVGMCSNESGIESRRIFMARENDSSGKSPTVRRADFGDHPSHLGGTEASRGRMRRTVAQRIRAKIDAGTLPTPEQAAYGVSTHPGEGRPCDGCDAPISAPDVVFTVDLPERQLRLHAECLVAWHGARSG